MREIIEISKQANERIFNSICELYDRENITEKAEDQKFYNSLIESIGEDRITFKDGETYVLSENAQSENLDIRFTEYGASWFEGLKTGEKLNSNESRWANKFAQLAIAYHQKYFTIVYSVKDEAQEKSGDEDCKRLLKALNDCIFSSTGSLLELDSKSIKGSDTYYSAKLKLNATLSVGSSMPIICRIYYKLREGTDPSLLTKEEAELVDKGIKRNIDKNGNNDGTPIAPNFITRLSEDLNKETGARNLTNCALFSDASMEALEEQMEMVKIEAKKKGQEPTLSLACNKVELISVAKITWPHIRYNVKYKGRNVFRMSYSLNGISLSCINCAHVQKNDNDAHDLLIENNLICFPSDHKLNKTICIYPRNADGVEDKSENGLNSVINKDNSVLKESNLYKHLIAQPRCNRHPGLGGECTRIVCEAQLMNPSQKCCDCPYPEVVYMDTTSTEPFKEGRIPTSELFFALDKMKMLPRKTGDVNNVHTCTVCGRNFSTLKRDLCALCYKTQTSDNDDRIQGKNLYKRYARVISPVTRLLYLFSKKKYCYEDDGMLIFVIGSRIYKFNKLNITDRKYLKSAERVKN